MADAIQIVTTAPDKELADRIARTLMEARLAACVQVSGPVESTYRWEGQIESAVEWQLWIKTTAARYAAIEQMIRRLHPYSVPEILALSVAGGNADYLRWLEESVTD